MNIFKGLLRKKVKFVGQGFSFPNYGEYYFVEDIKNGYAIYLTRFSKSWNCIFPKNLFE